MITLGRAGEDNRSFRLTNIDSTLSGFAGADYDMLVRRLPVAPRHSLPGHEAPAIAACLHALPCQPCAALRLQHASSVCCLPLPLSLAAIGRLCW